MLTEPMPCRVFQRKNGPLNERLAGMVYQRWSGGVLAAFHFERRKK
jgi:hypothetical protein